MIALTHREVHDNTISISLLGAFSVETEPKRGWRVGHEGRDSIYYEEKHGGGWRRIPIDGEMLTGRAHHVIYFGSIRFPDWAEGRREEIIGRIKSAFPEPDCEYDER